MLKAVSAVQEIEELARELGFDLFGVAPLRPPRDADRFLRWIAEGRHAGMEYLRQDAARIVDPAQILPAGRSILVLGLGHSRPQVELAGGIRLARYAAGRDYHNVLTKRLRRLLRRLKRTHGLGEARTIADSGPLLERSHAAEAGLGHASKAANLLHPALGPWFFLGEVLVDLDLEPTYRDPGVSCGSCTACIDTCPTGAILAPGLVDARSCISYHTIENPGRIPVEIRSRLGGWVFGCDVCSEVCPWGRKAPDRSDRFGTHGLVEQGPLGWLSETRGFEERSEGSALRRAGRTGLARNAALVLGTQPVAGAEGVLLASLHQDPSAVVREAAGWALSVRFGESAGVRAALERASQADPDAENRAYLRLWRERCGGTTSLAAPVEVPQQKPS